MPAAEGTACGISMVSWFLNRAMSFDVGFRLLCQMPAPVKPVVSRSLQVCYHGLLDYSVEDCTAIHGQDWSSQWYLCDGRE